MKSLIEPAAPAAVAPSLQALGEVALDAADELDMRLSGATESSTHIHKLAELLRKLFVGRKRPLLPPESIGLVCDVIESRSHDTHRLDYDRSAKIAQNIAEKLEAPSLTRDDAIGLIELCLQLHRAAVREPMVHDIPEDHPDVLTFF